MSLLKNLNTSANSQGEEDKLGGGGVLETNVYPSVVKMAFISKAASGALGLNVHLSIDGKELRETFWIQSGNEKGNKTFYVKDGKEYDLPGYIAANSLTLLTVGKRIEELDTEPKIVKLWDSAAKAEVNTEVQMVTELTNKEILSAVQKQLVNKQEKGDDNKYYDVADTREKNEVVKFFRADDKLSVPEIEKGVSEAVFHDQWVEANAGKVRDKTNKKLAANAPKAGAPGAPAGRTSLFSK